MSSASLWQKLRLPRQNTSACSFQQAWKGYRERRYPAEYRGLTQWARRGISEPPGFLLSSSGKRAGRRTARRLRRRRPCWMRQPRSSLSCSETTERESAPCLAGSSSVNTHTRLLILMLSRVRPCTSPRSVAPAELGDGGERATGSGFHAISSPSCSAGG